MSQIQLESSAVNTSLLTIQTTFGVDDWLFVLNVCVAILIGVMLRIHVWAFVAALIHLVLMGVTQLSPSLLEVYVRFARQAPRYSPFASTATKRRRLPRTIMGAIR